MAMFGDEAVANGEVKNKTTKDNNEKPKIQRTRERVQTTITTSTSMYETKNMRKRKKTIESKTVGCQTEIGYNYNFYVKTQKSRKPAGFFYLP